MKVTFSALATLATVIPSFVAATPMFNAPKAVWNKGSWKKDTTAVAPTVGSRSPTFIAPTGVWGSATESNSTHVVKRNGPGAAPHFVAYWDKWLGGENGPPATSVVNGYNVLILSFLLSSGPADQAVEWASLDAATRSSIKSSYAAAGISLMVAAFGSSEEPTAAGRDAVATANTMAAWVKTYGLDGIDVDYEDFTAINRHDGSAEQWLITFTQTLRAALPAGQYIITHAPVAPWFSPIYTAGAYRKVHSSVGSLIDWYNIQFYNQVEYTDCAGLLTASSSTYPNTAVFQINTSAGVPLNKIVIGKPATTADANSGYMTTSLLASCLAQAKAAGWTAGAMVWQFPNADAAWIAAVRASSWPVGGGGTTPPTTTSSAPPTTTTKPSGGSGSCAGVAAWNSASVYVGGQTATYGGYLWTAQWWTEADTPGGAAGVWVKGVAC